jgi:hypothetical protein
VDKEKTLALLLLDLCAFACSRSDDEDSLREFEAACAAVEKDFPFEAQVYRVHAAGLSHKDQSGDVARDLDSAQAPPEESGADARS